MDDEETIKESESFKMTPKNNTAHIVKETMILTGAIAIIAAACNISSLCPVIRLSAVFPALELFWKILFHCHYQPLL